MAWITEEEIRLIKLPVLCISGRTDGTLSALKQQAILSHPISSPRPQRRHPRPSLCVCCVVIVVGVCVVLCVIVCVVVCNSVCVCVSFSFIHSFALSHTYTNVYTQGLTPADSAKNFEAWLEQARLHVLENASHMVHMEQAEQVNQLIHEFLQQQQQQQEEEEEEED